VLLPVHFLFRRVAYSGVYYALELVVQLLGGVFIVFNRVSVELRQEFLSIGNGLVFNRFAKSSASCGGVNLFLFLSSELFREHVFVQSAAYVIVKVTARLLRNRLGIHLTNQHTRVFLLRHLVLFYSF